MILIITEKQYNRTPKGWHNFKTEKYKTHGRHILTNLHSISICSKRTRKPTSKTVERWGLQIYSLVRDIKNNSSKFISEQKFLKGKFSWQEGYGAFSYAHSQRDNVYQYILKQEEHHKKKTFKEEYLDFLQKFEVEYNEKYLFEWLD